MKNGKISESILKRSVLKQLHTNNEKIVMKSKVGEDAAVIDVSEDKNLITATSVMIFDLNDVTMKAALVVNRAVNNVAASGGKPVGIEIAILVPTTENEASLRELVKEIDLVADKLEIAVVGGHTQVTRAVKSIVVTVTALGVADEKLTFSQKIEPGMDIIMTGFAGASGVAILAQQEEKLLNRFSQNFIDNAKKFKEELTIVKDARAAMLTGEIAVHDVSEGGVFAALWDMAEAAKTGLDIDLKKIPIKQETIEICEFFDLNPYKLLSDGCAIIASRDGNAVVREIEKAGGTASIIGVATDSNDRVLIQGDERRFLETAQTDEIYKVL